MVSCYQTPYGFRNAQAERVKARNVARITRLVARDLAVKEQSTAKVPWIEAPWLLMVLVVQC